MNSLSDQGTHIPNMCVVNQTRVLAYIFDRIELDDDSQIARLALKTWARTAWGEIAVAFRATYANHAPGEI